MSYTSNYNLNIRVSNLESRINAGVPTSSPLDVVLTNGNSAGANDINLNSNDILNCSNLQVSTINGSAYPPSSPSSSVFNYKATTTSQAPPVSSGRIEWNNATQASSTQIFVSHIDDNGDDIEVILGALPTGYKILIQDQANSSNYQQWTITSVSVAVGAQITYGVSLVNSTHSFSNNDPILLITLSANQNLSQVLAVGNSAGANDINMNNNDITNVLNIVGSTGVGQDLNISSNNNILMTADNIDLGTTEVIYPSLATPARLRLKASGQVQVDNNGGGTSTASSAVVLNQVSLGGGILTEEVYNQRTGVNGSFSQKSFYAKNSAGGKLECARISAVAENITANRGQLDLGVAGSGGVVSSYISLSGNNDRINALRDINLNNNDITSCATITSSLNNQYSKEVVQYLNANSTAPTLTLESNLRYIAVNLGKANTWEQATTITSTGWLAIENITASFSVFGGYWVVGTDVGNIYYTNDSGANWTLQGSYGARIRCFETYSSYLAVGGDFTTTYKYIMGIDSGMNSFDITGGSGGLNAPVFCLYNNSANSCLYVGGQFDDFFGGAGSYSLKFITLDYFTNTWYPFSNAIGSGFSGGDVYSINKDTGNTNYIIVAGTYTDTIQNGSSTGISYLFTYITSSGFDLTGFFSIGLVLNNPCYTIATYSGGLYVGGAFSNTAMYSFCNTNYAFYMQWGGSQWDLYDYLFSPSNTINSIIFNPYNSVYYTTENNSQMYIGAIQTIPIPVGSAWNCVAYDVGNTYFATNAQTSVGFLLYKYDQNVGITITGGGNTFNSINGSNFTNCLLTNINSSVEMIWNSTLSKWFVISQEGCSFS